MSGGTTGTPKGALGTHAAYVFAGIRSRRGRHRCMAAKRDVICVPLPLFHVYANVGVQSLAVVNGNPLALVPNPRDLADLLATIRRVKPRSSTAVPTLYNALLNHPDVQQGRTDFKSIKICFSGASALLAETKQRFEALTGGRIVEGYSLTEAMMALCVNPVRRPNKLGSVGMPLPDVHVRVFDVESGTTRMPPNEVRRDRDSRHPADGRVLGQSDETALVLRDHEVSGDPSGSTGNAPSRPGCTQATSAISTTTATCSSSIGRRI
jgi:long-chain acyl-CoA synthetase